MSHPLLRLNIFNLLALLAIAPMLLGGLTASAQTQDWSLIWSDEFTGSAGTAPNPANWTLQQGLTPDGAQSYNCLYGQTTKSARARPASRLGGETETA